MDLSFRHIRYFVAAAEAGSVTGAAALVGVSQSAVTEAIKSIEHQLGVPLLQRHPRGVSLTHEGHQFLRHAHAMIEALTAAGRTLSAAGRKLTGRLGLGVSPMVAGYFLADLLARFRRTFPGVEVAPSEDRRPFIEQLLINGELDVAILIVSEIEEKAALAHEVLARSQNRLWLPPNHRFLKRDRVTLFDICEEPLIVLSADDYGDALARIFRRAGLSPRVLFETGSVEAVRSMVATGAGIAIAPDLAYRPWSLEGDRLEVRAIADPLPAVDVGVVWRRGLERMPAVEHFLQSCHQGQRPGHRAGEMTA